MTYSARNRDRYRVVASLATGAVAAACLAGTGAVMGTAAAANTQNEHDRAAARQRVLNAQPVVVEVARPTAEVVKIRTVTKPGAGPRIRVIRVGTGKVSGGSRAGKASTRKASTASRPKRAAPKPPSTSSGS